MMLATACDISIMAKQSHPPRALPGLIENGERVPRHWTKGKWHRRQDSNLRAADLEFAPRPALADMMVPERGIEPRTSGLQPEALPTELFWLGGNGWVRTSDLGLMRALLYLCATLPTGWCSRTRLHQLVVKYIRWRARICRMRRSMTLDSRKFKRQFFPSQNYTQNADMAACVARGSRGGRVPHDGKARSAPAPASLQCRDDVAAKDRPGLHQRTAGTANSSSRPPALRDPGQSQRVEAGDGSQVIVTLPGPSVEMDY